MRSWVLPLALQAAVYGFVDMHFVGDANLWISDLKEKAAGLKVGNGMNPDSDLGPVISKDSYDRSIG